jgi:hypothetical protein
MSERFDGERRSRIARRARLASHDGIEGSRRISILSPENPG